MRLSAVTRLRVWLALGLSIGCSPELAEPAWELRFDSAADLARWTTIDVRVAAGSCESASDMSAFSATLYRGIEPIARPDLPAGEYAFFAEAYDSTCRRFAAGCVAVELPSEEPILVDFSRESGGARCDSISCRAGLCDDLDSPEGLLPPNVTSPLLGERALRGSTTIRWEAAVGATEYEVRHGECFGPLGGCALDQVARTDALEMRIEVGDRARLAFQVTACSESGCGFPGERRLIEVHPRGDLDGDGVSEWAVAALEAEEGRGSVKVYRGPGELVAELIGDPGVRLGADLLMADIDGDANDEVVLSAPLANGGRGAVQVWDPTDDTLVRIEAEAGDEQALFGSALASCDIDGDGLSDLIVGLPEQDRASGRVEVFRSTGGSFSFVAGFDDPDLGAGNQFGASVGCVDFLGDGRAEIVIGRPEARNTPSVGRGAVFAFSASGEMVRSWRGDSPERGLGAQVEGTLDLDRNGDAEILILSDAGDRVLIVESSEREFELTSFGGREIDGIASAYITPDDIPELILSEPAAGHAIITQGGPEVFSVTVLRRIEGDENFAQGMAFGAFSVRESESPRADAIFRDGNFAHFYTASGPTYDPAPFPVVNLGFEGQLRLAPRRP